MFNIIEFSLVISLQFNVLLNQWATKAHNLYKHHLPDGIVTICHKVTANSCLNYEYGYRLHTELSLLYF